MFCAKCGEKIADGARFCQKCGTSLGAGAPAEPLVSSIGTTAKSTFERAVSDDAPKPLAFLYAKFNCKDEQSRRNVLIIAGLVVVGAFVALLILLSCIVGVQRHVAFRREMDKIDREYEREMKELDRQTEKWDREMKELDEDWEKAKKKIREMPDPFD